MLDNVLEEIRQDESKAFKLYSWGLIVSWFLAVGILVSIAYILIFKSAGLLAELILAVGDLPNKYEVISLIIIVIPILLVFVCFLSSRCVQALKRDYEMKRNLYLAKLRLSQDRSKNS